jgi:GT2 family glycosyltransferase
VIGRIGAVVLNYRTPGDTILAVRSLQAADTTLAPIVVVDNGSGDDSLECLRRHLQGIELLALERNVGFSVGCNAGIRTALDSGAEGVLLLNSDVVVPPGAPAAMAQILASQPRVGIVSTIVRRRQNPDVVESIGLSYRVATGRMRLIEHGSRVESLPRFESRIVDAVTGCAMLIRREVFESVGVLRDEYFFGFEDLDFCCRARERGWLSACAGTTFVLHGGHGSIGRRASARAYFATRNHLLVASRFPSADSRVRRIARLAHVVALNLAHSVRARDIPPTGGLMATVLGVRDFLRGKTGDAGQGSGQRAADR